MYNTGLANPSSMSGPTGDYTTTFAGYEKQYNPQTGQTEWVPRYKTNVKPSKQELAIYNQGVGTRTGAQTTANRLMANAGDWLAQPMTEQGPAWNYGREAGFNNAYNQPFDEQGYLDKMMASYNRSEAPLEQAAMNKRIVQGALPGGVQDYRANQLANDKRGEYQRQAADDAFRSSNESLRLRNEALQGDWENAQNYAKFSNEVKGQENALASSLRTDTINQIASLFGLGQWEFPEGQQYQGGQAQPVNYADLYSQ